MSKSGEWKLLETEQGDIVVLAYEPEAAFAYLWHRERGIQAHVWLFNTGTQKLAPSDLDQDAYQVPLQPDDISCTPAPDALGWDLSWGGQVNARLLRANAIGRSRFVTRETLLAHPWTG